MRAACEIIADIKDNKEVTYEELKLACLVLDFLLFQYKNDVKNLLKGGIAAELTRNGWYSDPKTSSAETHGYKLGYNIKLRKSNIFFAVHIISHKNI